jgi:rhomboid protease GluP
MEFAQKHIEQLPLEDLAVEDYLALAIESSTLLGWVFGSITEIGFIAYTNNGLFAWNAEIRLRIVNGIVTIQSESRGNELIDVRENKKNIQKFITAFRELRNTLSPEDLVPIYEKLKVHFI